MMICYDGNHRKRRGERELKEEPVAQYAYEWFSFILPPKAILPAQRIMFIFFFQKLSWGNYTCVVVSPVPGSYVYVSLTVGSFAP
jgi:hypothetical protein